MNLADELMGVGMRQPMKTGLVRRNYLSDDPEVMERERKRQRRREYQREWRKRNPEKVRAKRERDKVLYKDKIKARNEKWRKANIDYFRKYKARKTREYHRADPDHARAIAARYREKNREKINARRREKYAAAKGAA